MKFILIQVIGFIPSIIAFTSLQSPDRRKILILQFFCSVMWFTHYAMLGAATLAMTNIVNILRAVLCYCNDRPWVNKRWIPVGLGVLYIAGTALTWQGLVSVFPCMAMLLTTAALWSHNMQRTRLLFLLNSPLMLLSSLLTGAYACAAIECAAFVSFATAVYRYDIRPKQKAAGNTAQLSR